MQKINIDELDDLQEEMQELMADQEEVQEILGRDFSVNAYDEAELEEELDQLDDEIVNDKLEEVPGSKLPSQPVKPMPASPLMPDVASTDDELRNIMGNF